MAACGRALVRTWLAAFLLASVGSQQPRPQCAADGPHLVCQLGDTRLEVRSEVATWRAAHELCRSRRAFLVPSRAVFDRLLDYSYRVVQLQVYEDFWLGAKYLRNGYADWLLQDSDPEYANYEKVRLPPAVNVSSLCGRVTRVDNQLVLGWLPCEANLRVVCFSSSATEAELRTAGYRPTLTAVYGDRLIQTRDDSDEVLLVDRPALEGDFQLNITCGPGDSIIKDHFVLGKTEYLSRRWTGNFTITRQLFPPPQSDGLVVGSYWCQRYVDTAADPVVSGRLHVVSSEDMYTLTTSENKVLEILQMLFGNRSVTDYETRSGIVESLQEFLRSSPASDQVQFLALYDFIDDAVIQDLGDTTDYDDRERSETKNMTIIFGSSQLNDSLVGRLATQHELHHVLRCASQNVQGHLWRQSSSYGDFAASEPACSAPGLPSLVERRCRPGFGRGGAQWGQFCAAGKCEEQLPQCRPPPPICPSGFTHTGISDRELSLDRCIRLLPDVTYDERVSACRQQHPSASLLFPRRLLFGDFVIFHNSVNQTLIWLPFRRLWSLGAFLPDFLPLLSQDQESANLKADLNCSVVNSGGRVASSSCADRHAVLCTTRPLYGQDSFYEETQQSFRGQLCQHLLTNGAVEGAERCFAFICPDSSSRISWSAASSLCVRSNSSLASLTSQRQLDALLRFGRAHGRSGHVAVNLVNRDGQVVWGDGTPLVYPAIAPSVSTTADNSRGILDMNRGRYDLVHSDQESASCAVCERHIQVGPPQIFLFYGENASIFANVTSVHRLVDLREAISCLVSTSEPIEPTRQIGQEDEEGFRNGFRVRNIHFMQVVDDRAFIQISPSVDFGYLTCGLLIDELGDQITSNSLILIPRNRSSSVQEYVIGIVTGGLDNSVTGDLNSSRCELTFCGRACPCFNQSLVSDYVFKGNTFFHITYHPLRSTVSIDGRVIAHYFVKIDFNPALRRRRQTSIQNFDEAERDRPMSDDSVVSARADGVQTLREEFGVRLEYVNHARCCPAEVTDEPVRLSWPETCGGTATSVELCMDSSGQPALRRCLGGPLTGVQWGPVQLRGSRCTSASAITRSLHQLTQAAVTPANALSMADELQRLTAEPDVLVSQDIVSAVVTLENIQARLESKDPPALDDLPILQGSVVTAVSHLMDVERTTLNTATQLHGAGPRVVQTLERILRAGYSTTRTVNVTTRNVATRSGDFIGILSTSEEIVGSSLTTVARSASRSAVYGVESAILLESTEPDVPVIFLVYRDGRLLESPGQLVTSQVVSALLPTETDETQFRSEVLVTFRSRPGQCAPDPVCSFWDVASSRWSTRGCWLEKTYKDSDVCRCNHLTNFARIFNYEKDVYLSETLQRTLDVITYVGSALSLTGLCLTMCTFVLFKKWRKLRSSQIVMHMSMALAGVYVAFLGGLAATGRHVACACLSALLHYCLLATFGWMCVEAVFQYLRFVRVVGTYISRFMLKASLLVWGGSLVPVICVLAVRPHCYDGQMHVCWMDFQSFLYALVLPAVAVMVFNAVLFSRIVYALNCGRQKGLRTNQSEHQLAQRRLRVSLVTFVLLGLPWIFGFLSIREARLVFAVFFCICSMLQGFAVFLLMVAGEGGVRGLWRTLLLGQCCADSAETGGYTAANSGTGDTSEMLISSRGQVTTRM